MNSKITVLLVVLAFLAGCTSAEDVNEQFDAAVQGMSVAYFQHVPEAATQVGMREVRSQD